MSEAVSRLLKQRNGQCWRKVRYAELWKAQSAAKALNERKPGRDYRAYQCHHGCKGYHVGSEVTFKAGNAEHRKAAL